MTTPKGLIPALIGRFAAKLRFPQLFLFTAVLFFLDLLVPDLIPFIDEMLLGLLTLLLGMWKTDSGEVERPQSGETRQIKDITPPDR